MKPEDFFIISNDPEEFIFKGINLWKVYYNSYLDKIPGVKLLRKPTLPGIISRRIKSLPRMAYVLVWLLIKRWINRETRIFFFGAHDRVSEIEGKVYDTYNYRIIAKLGREKCFLYEKARVYPDKIYTPDFVYDDLIILSDIIKSLCWLLYKSAISKYANNIVQQYPELGFSRLEIELAVINFYGEYIFYRYLLRMIGSKQALLICSYSKEDFIAACKSLGVEVLELMHGQINSTHPYYDCPDINHYPSFRQLFPNKIGVYGEFWRQILIKKNFLQPEAIIDIGYYLTLPEVRRQQQEDNRKKILLTTQPTVQKELVEYIRFLKKYLDRDKWVLIIKPHPSEKSGVYHELQEPNFIEVSYINTYMLLNQVDIHISAYSTVIYEAIRYPVINYALYVDRVENRWRDVLSSGVALPLFPNELPSMRTAKLVDSKYFFDEVDIDKLFHS